MKCLHKVSIIKITALLFITSFTYVDAQKNPQLINSFDTIRQGLTLADSSSYDKASALYEMVSRNDTNYLLSLFEDAVSRESNNEDSLALIICDKGLAIPSDYIPDFYKLKAGALIDLKKYNEAINLMHSAIAKYPNVYLLYFTLGLAHYEAKQYDSAIAYFEQSIKLNTFHTLSHYYLAKCCLAQGRVIPALLSLQFCLVLEPNNSRAFTVVQLIEQVGENKYEFNDSTRVDPDKYGDQPFSDLALLVKSQVALNPEYKSKTDINYNLVKQCQLIYDNLKYVPNTSNFWMNTYVPFFADMRKQDYFDAYAHYIMQSVNDPALQESIKKDKKKIDEYIDWAEKEIVAMRHTRQVTVDGKIQTLVCYYYSNHLLQAIGPEDKKGNQVGEWTIYHENNGTVDAKGSFGKDGKRTGTWQWFYIDGTPEERTNYEEGDRNGPSATWYENGAPKAKYNYKDDKLDGLAQEYSNSGIPSTYGSYKDGKPMGPFTLYYADGKKHYLVNYGEDGFDSLQEEYYVTGKPELTSIYKNGKKNGTFIEYWPNGKIKDQGEYKDDKATGLWKFYYEDGPLQKQITYINNNPTGMITTYYRNGKKKEETSYNDDGKLDGPDIAYDDDGIKYAEYDYKKDALQHYAYYDKNAKTISDASVSDKKLRYDNYYPNGVEHSIGELDNDLRSGEWKFYSVTSSLATTENYIKGKLNGNDTDYYYNGKIKAITPYKDDSPEGEYKEYYINDTLKSIGWYVAGLAQGDWYYYNKHGGLESHYYYLNGQVYGYVDYYNPDGKLTEEDYFNKLGYLDKVWVYDSTGKNIVYTYISDEGNGPYKSTYPGGQTKTERTYMAGNSEGTEKRYYYNGKLATEGDYLLDKHQGPYTTFYDNGDTETIYNYDNGELSGPGRTFYKGHKTDITESYLGDVMDGAFKKYYLNGALNREGYFIDSTTKQKYSYYSPDKLLYCVRWYTNDIITAYSYLGKDGKLLPQIPVKNGTAKVTTYFANGNKALECTYTQGNLEGKRVEYFSNGKVLENENYSLGDLSGLQIYYYSNGNPNAKENYYMGEKDGTCTYYFENGKVERKENWVLGYQQGPTTYYDLSGKLIKTAIYYNNDEVSETSK